MQSTGQIEELSTVTVVTSTSTKLLHPDLQHFRLYIPYPVSALSTYLAPMQPISTTFEFLVDLEIDATTSYSTHDLVGLSKLSNLNRLTLRGGGPGITDRLFRMWSECKTLNALQYIRLIDCTEITAAGLSYLSKLPSLELVWLVGHVVRGDIPACIPSSWHYGKSGTYSSQSEPTLHTGWNLPIMHMKLGRCSSPSGTSSQYYSFSRIVQNQT